MDEIGSSTSSRTRSLILAAHGSITDNHTNRTIERLAHNVSNKIQLQYPNGNFRHVTTAFLNGEPLMTNVLESLPPGDVVIVPVMTSNGYYLKKLPALFEQNDNFDQFRVHMTDVVGVHDSIPTLIANRIRRTLVKNQIAASDTTAVLIGHGTRRNPTSGDSTFALADKVQMELASDTAELKFETCFLDQDPEIATIRDQITTRHTLIVPFLMGCGPHATTDIPSEFGLPTGPSVRFPLIKENGNGLCICDSPVGMYPDLANVCLEMAEAAIENFPVSNPHSSLELGSMSLIQSTGTLS